ncbi:ABC-three component system middle component 5 [Sphingomonas sp. LB3N6]|uniref:ABC-three component system middle component 5 n=1 Tax=Sphingomonas fucosidasi TaxID=3096164 RepID=UPI002FCB7CE8
MLGLNFYPHQDVYHTAFRALALARITGGIKDDAYRIVDYFTIFPFDLPIIRHRGAQKKRLAEQFASVKPYKWYASPSSTFLQLAEYQTIALDMLRERDLIERQELRLTELFAVDAGLMAEFDGFVERMSPVINYILGLNAEYGLYGEGGLKDRSTLMTFKYDVKNSAHVD